MRQKSSFLKPRLARQNPLGGTMQAITASKTSVSDQGQGLDSELHKKFQSFEFKSLVTRLQQKLELTESEAEKLFVDLKTWMYLCAVSDEPLSPPKMVDEAWHNFVLFTKEYAKFCQDFCGHFVHHSPHDHTSTATAIFDEQRQKCPDLFRNLGLTGKNWQMEHAGSGCSHCSGDSKCCSGGNCSNSWRRNCSNIWHCKLQNSGHKTVAIF